MLTLHFNPVLMRKMYLRIHRSTPNKPAWRYDGRWSPEALAIPGCRSPVQGLFPCLSDLDKAHLRSSVKLMNAVDIYLWQFPGVRMQEIASLDQTLTDWRSSFNPYLLGIGVALLTGAIIFGLFALAYHPRIPRTGFLLTGFGLFGGTPTLYYHTRPPSLFGIFLKSRHRIKVVHKTHRKHAAGSAWRITLILFINSLSGVWVDSTGDFRRCSRLGWTDLPNIFAFASAYSRCSKPHINRSCRCI